MPPSSEARDHFWSAQPKQVRFALAYNRSSRLDNSSMILIVVPLHRYYYYCTVLYYDTVVVSFSRIGGASVVCDTMLRIPTVSQQLVHTRRTNISIKAITVVRVVSTTVVER